VDDRDLILGRGRNFSHRLRNQTGPETHPASCPILQCVPRVLFPG